MDPTDQCYWFCSIFVRFLLVARLHLWWDLAAQSVPRITSNYLPCNTPNTFSDRTPFHIIFAFNISLMDPLAFFWTASLADCLATLYGLNSIEFVRFWIISGTPFVWNLFLFLFFSQNPSTALPFVVEGCFGTKERKKNLVKSLWAIYLVHCGFGIRHFCAMIIGLTFWCISYLVLIPSLLSPS